MKKDKALKDLNTEKANIKQLLPLYKGEKKDYKIIIPEEVESKIRFLCDKIHDVEWSGTLFYDIEGTFEDNNLVVTCKDIYLMDIGSAAYTEFNMSPDVISYMAQNPELLDYKTGLIHSHNNMATFFSGTDTATLQEEGTDRNHFVSLIVNNIGAYTAGITQKIKSVKDVNETFSFSTYGGAPVVQDRKYQETSEKIIWYELQIEKHEVSEGHTDIVERMQEINKKKEEEKAKIRPFTYNTPFYQRNNYDSLLHDKPKTFKKTEDPLQGRLFDDWDDYDYQYGQGWKFDDKKNLPEDTHYAGTYDEKIIKRCAKQLVTCNYLLPNEGTIDLKQWVKNMPQLYKKRFGSLDSAECKSAFENWADLYVQYVLENDLDPAFAAVDEEEELSTKAFDLVMYLTELEDNPNEYLQIIIDAISNFIE